MCQCENVPISQCANFPVYCRIKGRLIFLDEPNLLLLVCVLKSVSACQVGSAIKIFPLCGIIACYKPLLFIG